MSTTPKYDPFEHADRLGIAVEFELELFWLTAEDDGVYVDHLRTIYLRPDLPAVVERCVLAHELGHAHYRHTETTGRTEILANLYAIENLICMDDLIDSIRCSPDMGRWALDLDVTGPLLRLYVDVHRPEIQRAFRNSYLARLAS